MAQRIVDWRTANGRFTSVDDLMSVTGIGQKTFDGLKDLVTI
jgi:competence protein ComEA